MRGVTSGARRTPGLGYGSTARRPRRRADRSAGGRTPELLVGPAQRAGPATLSRRKASRKSSSRGPRLHGLAYDAWRWSAAPPSLPTPTALCTAWLWAWKAAKTNSNSTRPWTGSSSRGRSSTSPPPAPRPPALSPRRHCGSAPAGPPPGSPPATVPVGAAAGPGAARRASRPAWVDRTACPSSLRSLLEPTIGPLKVHILTFSTVGLKKDNRSW